eukprot:TCONS_00027575-protein
MENFIFLLLALSLNLEWITGCVPDMFTRKFDNKLVDIPVTSLSYDASKTALVEKLIHDVLQDDFTSDAVYQCKHSQTGWVNITTDVSHFVHLKVSGLQSNPPKMICQPFNETYGKPQTYYYIGFYDRTFNVAQGRSLEESHFFLQRSFRNRWALAAVGKFYPCSDQALSVYNARLMPNTGSQSDNLIGVSHLQFRPSWPHLYMAKHGEPLNSSILANHEKLFSFPGNTLTVNHHSILWYDHTGKDAVSTQFLADAWLDLQNGDRADVHLSLTIEKQYWKVDMSVVNHNWNKIFAAYFGQTNPFLGIPNDDLGEKLDRGVFYMSTTFTSEHGNEKKGQIAHDGHPRYGIAASGRFHSNQNMPVHLFRGLNFDFKASGKLLETATLNFEMESNSCLDHVGDPLNRFTRVHGLWGPMRKVALPKPGQKEAYIVEENIEYTGNLKCPRNYFRFGYIKFDGLDSTMTKSTITFSFIENRFGRHLRFVCTAYMRIKDLITILETEG